MATQTPATAEIEKWLRIRFSQIIESVTVSGSERNTQNPAGVDSGSGPTFAGKQYQRSWKPC